jgi:hypothetical protein
MSQVGFDCSHPFWEWNEMRLLRQTINAVGVRPKRGSKPTYEEAGRVWPGKRR